MARFIDTPNERTLVNKYVDSYMNGVNQYAKYIDSTPSFATYYSRDVDTSTENPGLGQVKEIVGVDSPLRYNKIKNFPLYGVEEVNPSINADGISGINVDIENTAVILPDTIIPKPDDLFVLNYDENTDKNSAVYRITGVDINAVDSNTYYQISYVSTPYDYNILNKRQVVDDYRFVYGNTGSKYENILLEDRYIEVASLEQQFVRYMNFLLDNFYDEDRNMVYFKDKDGNHIFMDEVHDFLNNHKLLIESRTFIRNIYLPNMDPKSNYRKNASHFYNIIEGRKKLYTNRGIGAFSPSLEKIDKLKNKLFIQFPEDFYKVKPVTLFKLDEIDKVKMYWITNQYQLYDIGRYHAVSDYDTFLEDLMDKERIPLMDKSGLGSRFFSYQSKRELIEELKKLVKKFDDKQKNSDTGEILPNEQTDFKDSFIYTICSRLTMEEYFKIHGINEKSLLEDLSKLDDDNVVNKMYKILLAYAESNEKFKEYESTKDEKELEKLNKNFDKLIKDYLMKGDLYDEIEERFYYDSFNDEEMIKLYMYLPCMIYILQSLMNKLLIKK